MTTARRLTLHVLDVTRGVPAGGLAFTLVRLDADRTEVIVRGETDPDGRTAAPVLSGTAMTPGRYQFEFEVGDYFTASGTGSADYLDVVPVRFGIGAGTDHVHVALLVTPWSYTTYRGS